MKKALIITALLFVSSSFAQTFTNYTTADGLLSNNVSCLDIDATNAIWFGTQLGVSVLDGAAWTSYTTADGLVDNNVTAIFVTSTGDIWAGTDFGASVLSGGIWTTYTTAEGLGNNQIKCINEDLDGDIWFGTNNGASEWSGSTWTNLGTADGLPFGGVTALDIHSGGYIWMGSGLGGIIVYDGTAITTTLTEVEGLTDDRIRGIAMDASDNRWIATSEGISVFDNSNTHTGNHTIIFTLPAPDTLNPIEDIKIDGQGIIWAGVYVDYLVTEGGVCAYNGNDWIEFHVSDGLVGPVVRQLAIDGNDAVWIATSTGVSKLTDHTVGVGQINDYADVLMYPNPARDELTLTFDEAPSTQIDIYSMTMQHVKSIEFDAHQHKLTIPMTELSAGVYFIQMGEVVERIIVR